MLLSSSRLVPSHSKPLNAATYANRGPVAGPGPCSSQTLIRRQISTRRFRHVRARAEGEKDPYEELFKSKVFQQEVVVKVGHCAMHAHRKPCTRPCCARVTWHAWQVGQPCACAQLCDYGLLCPGSGRAAPLKLCMHMSGTARCHVSTFRSTIHSTSTAASCALHGTVLQQSATIE